MKVKRFVAANMQLALRKVSQELGADAVIMSSKKVAEGFEVVAALDYQPGASEESGDVARQLELQRELEAAKASREIASPEQEQRLNYARQSDVTSADGLKDVLQGLKQKDYGQSAATAEAGANTSSRAADAASAADISAVQSLDERVKQSEARYGNAMAAMSGELRKEKKEPRIENKKIEKRS